MKRPPLLPFVLAAAVVIILGCACSLEATRGTRRPGSHGAACQPFSSLGQQPLPIIRGPVGLLSPPPFDSRVVAVHTANGFFGRSNPAPHIRWGDDCSLGFKGDGPRGRKKRHSACELSSQIKRCGSRRASASCVGSRARPSAVGQGSRSKMKARPSPHRVHRDETELN